MYMLNYLKDMLKEVFFDIHVWTVMNLEGIGGISIGCITMQTLSFKSELLHSVISIFTAITSAYIIHRLKKVWTKKKK